MVAAIVYQLTRNLTPEQIKEGGFDAYFVDHTTGVYPQFASGTPWSAMTFQSKGDPITDLFEDLAAEQKARTTYDNLLRLIDDPDVREPIKFLRAREVVHFQRFGEAMRRAQARVTTAGSCENAAETRKKARPAAAPQGETSVKRVIRGMFKGMNAFAGMPGVRAEGNFKQPRYFYDIGHLNYEGGAPYFTEKPDPWLCGEEGNAHE